MCLSNRHLALGGALEGARIPFPEPGVPKHYAPSRTVVITHARIALSIEPEARTFQGHATLSLRALPTFAGSFSLDLDDVEVQSVKSPTGEQLPFTCADGRIHVRCASLPEQVEIEWQGRDAARGMYFTGPCAWDPKRQHMAWTQCQDEDAHYVFPCHDHPGVKHPWTILLDAPTRMARSL